MRHLTEEHKKKISEAKTGRPRTTEFKARLALRLMGGRHHRAKLWTLESPTGGFFITKDISGFCELHELAYSALRHKAQTQDARPICRGRSKGWSVLKCENTKQLIDNFIPS